MLSEIIVTILSEEECSKICDEFCRYPREWDRSDEELWTEICSKNCPLVVKSEAAAVEVSDSRRYRKGEEE